MTVLKVFTPLLGAVVAGLALACGGTVLAAAGPQAAAATGGVSATPVRVGLDDRRAAARAVRLVTGEQVGGAGRVARRGGSSSGSAVTFTSADGHHHVLPFTALRYAGRGVDPVLFDVDAVAAAESAHAGRLPLRLTFAAGSTPTAPPGVALTAVVGTTAHGYVRSADDLAAAMTRHGAESDPVARLAPGLRAMSLDVAPPPPVTPNYPVHPLRITAADLTGAPANTEAYLINSDSVNRVQSWVAINDGTGTVQVPAGHYALAVFFADLDSTGTVTAAHIVQRDVTVAASSDTTVSTAEGEATSRVSVSTPKPANQDQLAVDYHITDTAGTSTSVGANVAGGTQLYVKPRRAPSAGALHYRVRWYGSHYAGPDDRYADYRYVLAFASDNEIPADETFVATPHQLATMHNTMFTDPASPGEAVLTFTPVDNATLGSSAFVGLSYPVPTPGTDVVYLGTADGGQWQEASWTDHGVFGTVDDHQRTDVRSLQGGRSYTEDWGRGPLAAAAGVHSGPQECVACGAGTRLTVGLYPLGDSAHVGALGVAEASAVTRFRLYRNDTVVFDQPDTVGATLTGVPGGAAVYRGVLDLDRTTVGGISQSTASHTDVTARFDPATAAALPSADSCAGGDTANTCRIVPLLTMRHQLAVDRYNTSSASTQTMHLDVAHLSYDGAGSHAAITSVTVSVSYDGGATWRAATVAGAGGSYRVSWPNQVVRSGVGPAITVTATDADGGSITQTTSNAYTYTPAATAPTTEGVR